MIDTSMKGGEESKRFEDDEVLSSDEEQEKIEEEKAKFTATVKLENISGPIKNIVVCAQGSAQALTKIIFDGKLKEAGKADVTQQEKTKEVMKVFYVEEHQILILNPDSVKSSHSGSVIDQLFSQLPNTPQRLVLLDTVYKTNYSTTDTGSYHSIDGEAYPLKYYKSSHTSGDQLFSTFLSKHKPAGVLNILGGFEAALLVHAELNGLSAAAIHAIVDSHYVSAETLQAFAPVLTEVL